MLTSSENSVSVQSLNMAVGTASVERSDRERQHPRYKAFLKQSQIVRDADAAGNEDLSRDAEVLARQNLDALDRALGGGFWSTQESEREAITGRRVARMERLADDEGAADIAKAKAKRAKADEDSEDAEIDALTDDQIERWLKS